MALSCDWPFQPRRSIVAMNENRVTRMRINTRGRKLIIGLMVGLAAGVVIWRRRHGALIPPHDRKRALPKPDPNDLGEPGRNTDARLDAAIEESFPASDPVSIRIE